MPRSVFIAANVDPRHEDALAAATEAAGFYCDLARVRPEAFTADLAMSLNTLAAMRSELGRRDLTVSDVSCHRIAQRLGQAAAYHRTVSM